MGGEKKVSWPQTLLTAGIVPQPLISGLLFFSRLPGNEVRPCIHDRTALLQQVGPVVSGFHLVFYRVGQGAFREVTGNALFTAPVTKAGTESMSSGRPARRVTGSTNTAQEGGQYHVGQHHGTAWRRKDQLLMQSLSAPKDFKSTWRQGDRCMTFAFMRSAGMVQTACLKSISSQVIPLTSPERQAVRIRNSSMDRVTSWPVSACKCSCAKVGISLQGMAG